jgi:Zn-dependent peptidase ImmA (M78 family)
MGTDYDEMQANAFAAELLMPRSFVLRALRAFTEENDDFTADELVEALASEFAVSSAAMGYRLMNLGITLPQ